MHSKELYKLLSADFIKIIYYSLKKLMESKSSKINLYKKSNGKFLTKEQRKPTERKAEYLA